MWGVDNFIGHSTHTMAQPSQLEVKTRWVRGTRLASERALVIKEQTLGINYNSEKFWPVLIKTSGSWQAARLSSQCLGRVLGLELPFQLPTWTQNMSSVSPTESRALSQHQQGSGLAQGAHLQVQEWICCVFSELIPWCGSESCSAGAGLSTPGCSGATAKVQSQVWWWLLSVQEWVLEYVAQTVVVVVI